MKYSALGQSGLKISQLVLGGAHIGNGLDEAAARKLIDAALEKGVNALYTANIFAAGLAQDIIGRVVHARRKDVVIINKIGRSTEATRTPRGARLLGDFELWQRGVAPTAHGLSRISLTRALDQSLKRLQTDYVDVSAVHYWDQGTPLEETLETLDGFVRAGKARYIGCSNWAAWQVHHAYSISESRGLAKLRAFQTEYNLLNRWPEREQLSACAAAGVGVLVFNSLASNYLAGEVNTDKLREMAGPEPGRNIHLNDYINDESPRRAEELVKLAGECGRSPVELAQGWALSRPAVTGLLVGPNDPAELEPMLNAVNDPLNRDELAAVEARVAVQAPPPDTSRTPVLRLV